MFSRYSSRVVAPIRRSSPRASMGLSMLPASMELSPVAPAPTTVWISSMKVTICPSEFLISSRTALSRSSNSPRYLAPATMEARSRAIRVLPRRLSGTSPATIRWARPSTTAVLPTPGSPMSTGLFLVRRLRTWMMRRISASRPITGSSLPERAIAVRSVPYFSSAWKVFSGSAMLTLRSPRTPGQGGEQRLMGGAGVAQQLPDGVAPGGEAQQQVLGGDEGVPEPVGLVLGSSGWPAAALRDSWACCTEAARGGRQRLDGGARLDADGVRVRSGGAQQRDGDALALVHERLEQVGRLHLRVPRRRGVHGGRRESLLALGGEFGVQRELLPE